MAFTIPETIPGSVTTGERKVFVALRDHLPEDYLVYYDIAVKGRHPDFIVIGPDLGLVVLEVKDWRLDEIVEVTAAGVTLRGADGERRVENPMRQVRDYLLRTVDLLKQRPLLCANGKLRCGWADAAVFPSLKADAIRTPALFGPALEDAFGAGRVLTADDLTAGCLLPRLRNLLPAWAPRLEPLTSEQMDEIRGVLYPEIRVGWGQSPADVLRVMDRDQERLARTLGEGHRLLRGVAGSGKTITLICRARYLRERYPDWRILVLCYNAVLAESLRDAIGTGRGVRATTFHSWCLGRLRQAGVLIAEPNGPSQESDEYWDRLPSLLLEAHEQGRVAPGTYDAILVDEGQDFGDDWYRVVLRALNPATNSLFIALDSSQNIYRRKVSWRDIGIQIVGRTRVLRVNYRNTRPIIEAAYQAIRELDSVERAVRDEDAEYVAPAQALRDGPTPEVRRCRSLEASRRHALDWIQERLARGVAGDDILVLAANRSEIAALDTQLKNARVKTRRRGQPHDPEAVRLLTIHSAKGLDAEHVLLVGAHDLQYRAADEARRLLYIAMTRARNELCISYHRHSPLIAGLRGVSISA